MSDYLTEIMTLISDCNLKFLTNALMSQAARRPGNIHELQVTPATFQAQFIYPHQYPINYRVPACTGKSGKFREVSPVRETLGNLKFYQKVREKSVYFGSVREKSGKIRSENI